MESGEEMAFPLLFPHGINGYNFPRQMKIPRAMYFKHRLYHKHGYFRKKYDLLITCCSKHGPDAAEDRDQC